MKSGRSTCSLPPCFAALAHCPARCMTGSIVIRLERAKPGELRERFDSRRVERETELCRKLARWCADNAARLESCDPTLPPGAFNRLADNWRPLFAIAEIAGGDWPQRAADAFTKLTGREDSDAQGIGTMLLADIAEMFTDNRRETSCGQSKSQTTSPRLKAGSGRNGAERESRLHRTNWRNS